MIKKDHPDRWRSYECSTELDRDTNSAKLILQSGYQHLSVGARATQATA